MKRSYCNISDAAPSTGNPKDDLCAHIDTPESLSLIPFTSLTSPLFRICFSHISSNTCPFSNLPSELYSLIFSYGTFREFAQLLFVSKWTGNLLWNYTRYYSFNFHSSPSMIHKALSYCNPSAVTHVQAVGKVDDNTMEGLREFKNLTHIILRDCPISDIGVSHLQYLDKLQVIDFVRCPRITSRVLSYFSELIDLNFIRLRSLRTERDVSTIHHLMKLTNLSKLELWSPINGIGAMDSEIHLLQNFTKLERLCLAYLKQSKLSSLASLTNLQLLALAHKSMASLSSLPLDSLSNLSSLSLSTPTLTDTGVYGFTSLKKLEHLGISSNYLTDEGIRFLCGLNIKDMGFVCRRMTDVGLSHIGKLTNLVKLKLSHSSSITDEGILHLTNLTKLEFFQICQTKNITFQGLSVAILPMLSLRSLLVYNCFQASDHEVKALENIHPLCSLSIVNEKFISEEM